MYLRSTKQESILIIGEQHAVQHAVQHAFHTWDVWNALC